MNPNFTFLPGTLPILFIPFLSFRNALMHVALSVDQEEFEQRICQGHAYMEYPDPARGFKRLQTQRKWR